MAINTDAEFEKTEMGETETETGGGGGGGATEFRDTQKLLGVLVSDGKDGVGSCSDSRRPSVKSLKSLKSLSAEQNSYKSAGTGSVQSLPRSPAPERTEPEPSSYMWLALLSCFCPAVPFNVIALYFSHVVSQSVSLPSHPGSVTLRARGHTLGLFTLIIDQSIN